MPAVLFGWSCKQCYLVMIFRYAISCLEILQLQKLLHAHWKKNLLQIIITALKFQYKQLHASKPRVIKTCQPSETVLLCCMWLPNITITICNIVYSNNHKSFFFLFSPLTKGYVVVFPHSLTTMQLPTTQLKDSRNIPYCMFSNLLSL